MALSVKKTFAFSFQDYEGGFQLGRWEGSAEGGYLFEDGNSHSSTSSQSTVRHRFDELTTIKNDGMYVIDPRLLVGSAGLDLDLYQEQDRYSHGGLYSYGLLWGYNVDATLFSELPENATLFANQNQSEVNTTFGGRTRVDNSNLGLRLQVTEDSHLKDYGLYYFSSQLDAREEQSDERMTQLGETSELDQKRYIVNYAAHKGFQTADLRFRYQFDDVRNSGISRLAFQNQQANLDYSLDFGPRLNRTWDSNIFYYSLTGTTTPTTILLANESLSIAHFDNLSTSYQYWLSYSDVQGQGSTTDQVGIFQVTHRVYDNFSHELSLGYGQQNLPQGDVTNYWIEGSGDYTRAIPWRGVFTLHTGGQYLIQDNNLSSSQVQVTNEPHTAIATGFRLNNTFVLTATVVVSDKTQGMIACVLNVDYSVIQTGNVTQIIPIPTSLIIRLGDELLVSYSYDLPANARISTTTRSASVGLAYPWIDLSYSYDTFDQNLLSGEGAQFLQHQTSQTVGVGIHHEWERLEARADATYQELNSNNLAYSREDFSQYLSYLPGWETSLDLNGQESFTNYTEPKQRSRYYSLRLNANRFFQGGLTASLFAGLRGMENSQFPTETDIDTGARAVYTLGKLQLSSSATWTDRTWGSVKSQDLLFQIRIRRQFY